uniref:Uncharacterized protein n=1 Tax=Anguilla anguilla TaxID=7936 RepID=A0A0E9U654_ANGAN
MQVCFVGIAFIRRTALLPH